MAQLAVRVLLTFEFQGSNPSSRTNTLSDQIMEIIKIKRTIIGHCMDRKVAPGISGQILAEVVPDWYFLGH